MGRMIIKHFQTRKPQSNMPPAKPITNQVANEEIIQSTPKVKTGKKELPKSTPKTVETPKTDAVQEPNKENK